MIDALNIFDFFKKFPDEKTCEDFFIRLRWPRGVCCPHCDNHRIYRLEKQKRFKCGACRKQFSIRTGSVLAESKVTLQQWLMAAWLLTIHRKGFSSVQLAETLGVTQKTAWFLAQRIRKSFKEGGGPFNGAVEIDDIYIGGKGKNKCENKQSNTRLVIDQDAVGKTMVMDIPEHDGRAKTGLIKDAIPKTLCTKVTRMACEGETIYADDCRGYLGLDNGHHENVKYLVGEYMRSRTHTNRVVSSEALLKRIQNENHQLPTSVNSLTDNIDHGMEPMQDRTTWSERRKKASFRVTNLTKRQYQILDLVLAGNPSKNIAADLGISRRTVEKHRAAIMDRMGAKSVPELVRLALFSAQR